jgi:hypothetical protein
MKRTQIYFTEEEHKFLKKKAYEQDISMAEVIRFMVEKFIKEEKNNGGSEN